MTVVTCQKKRINDSLFSIAVGVVVVVVVVTGVVVDGFDVAAEAIFRFADDTDETQTRIAGISQ